MAVPVRYTVALDLAKHTHVAVIFQVNTQQPCETVRIPVSQAGFTAFEAKLTSYASDPGELLIGCEATGHYGETLLRRLQNCGYRIVRLNPTQVVQFRRGLGRHAKTDKLDAAAMALQLAVTDVIPEQPRSETQQTLQRLTRLRLDFVEEQNRWINRARALLNQLFPELETLLKDLTTKTALTLLSTYPAKEGLAQASLNELTQLLEKTSRKNKGQAFAQQLIHAAQTSVGLTAPGLLVEYTLVISQLLTTTERIQVIEAELRHLTQQWLTEYSEGMGLAEPLTLPSFPYGSHLAIGTLLAEIGAPERFASVKHLLSYLGWCPDTRESGASVSQHPAMARRGNRFVRRILWLLAIGAVRSVPEYWDYYTSRIQAGKNRMKTIVAVGRKLLSAMYTVLRTGIAYDPTHYLQFSARTT